MASRVALLILVTSMFAVIWSGDQPDRIAAIDRPTKVFVGKRAIDQSRQFPIVGNSLGEHESPVRSSIQSSNERHLNAPLPEGISAGTFLVADQYGRTEIRVVSVQEAFTGGTFRGGRFTDHYEVHLGNLRWHFIRLNSNSQGQNSISSKVRSAIQ